MVKNLPAIQETWVQSLDRGNPVVLPGESHGRRSLADYSPWGHKESDINERLTLSLFKRNTYH